MKRITVGFGAALLCLLMFAVSALAFGWGDVKSFITGETWPVLITGAVFLVALVGGALFLRIIQTLREAGEAMIAVADAAADKRVSKDELERIKTEIRDVVNIWRPTPEPYLPDAPVEPPPIG
jgi:hypothetical protein